MKLRYVLLLIIVLPVAFGGLWWLTAENPVKDVESLAMRHADKLPLAYFGKRLFDRDCASCHDNPQMHAPTREALGGFSKESIIIAMEFGKMTPMAAHLSKTEKGLIAIYLAGTAPASAWVADHRCDAAADDATTPFVHNWGLGAHNQRYVPPELTNITRDNVGSLELAWSLAFPKVTDMRSQPAVVGDNLYFGDKTGQFYAIDRHTGCVREHLEVLSGVRSAITVAELDSGKTLLVFADSLANIYAVNAANFEVEWQRAAQLYETSVITGSITHHGNQLFVPVSSYEVAVSGSPDHVCCKSHGGVIALDVNSGEQQWAWHGTQDATLQGQNADGANLYGPSGVSVWSTPTVDAERGLIYIGTGEN
ncbi:MAG: PQQ-binding-like beta-propeller repeat protein, partial [Halioglobus sp.]|nr:PQQ-binding-like beta-propeller repeat protein [Halioglobus sp.]